MPVAHHTTKKPMDDDLATERTDTCEYVCMYVWRNFEYMVRRQLGHKQAHVIADMNLKLSMLLLLLLLLIAIVNSSINQLIFMNADDNKQGRQTADLRHFMPNRSSRPFEVSH